MPLALVLLSCLAQQADPVLAGRVVDGAGKPVAEATVTLLARPMPRHLDPAHEHRIVTTTDAHGAFRAALHADGVYSVWAATAEAATAIAEGETAPGFVEVRLACGTGPRTIAIEGLDAWSEAATFRYRALVGSENLDFAPVTLRDGTLVVPPLPPFENRAIEVLAADGRVLWVNDPERYGGTIALPPPSTWTVHVTDDKQAPLPGVEVLAHVRNYWATESDGVSWGERFRNLWPSQGRTGADGTLTMRSAHSDAHLWLLSCKDGFAMSLDGRNGQNAMHAGKLVPVDANAPADRIDISLRPAPPLARRLATQKGEPLAVDAMFLTVRVNARDANGGGYGQPFSFALPIAGDRATVPQLPEGTELEGAATTFAPAVREQLRKRFGFAPTAWTLSHPESLGKDVTFDADHWHALAVITADGRPAANTPVFLGMANSEGTIRRTDRRGRLLFEAASAMRASVYARDGVGTAVVEGDETRLELRAVRPTQGRVVDAEGKPVAGARVSLELQGQSGGTTGEYQPLAWLLRGCSDADGRFEVLLPPFATSVKLRASGAKDSNLAFDWDPEKPTELVITVSR